MFSKAKRFDIVKTPKKTPKKDAESKSAMKPKTGILTPASKGLPTTTTPAAKHDAHLKCASTTKPTKVATPKSLKSQPLKRGSSVRRLLMPSTSKKEEKQKNNNKVTANIIKGQKVELRNKNHTISEYYMVIEQLKGEIAQLKKEQATNEQSDKAVQALNEQLNKININGNTHPNLYEINEESYKIIDDLKSKILTLEEQCDKLEMEVSEKQVELTSLEEHICIRDGLCKDLQEKLTTIETTLEETKQRLEMVKGHHALALEANESIRREYKAELETMKIKLDEEKQLLIAKSKSDQDAIKNKYSIIIENIKEQITKEKDEAVKELQQTIAKKDAEMKAKLEQIDEATHEKLRLCEIQFEERSRSIQEHWTVQEEKIRYMEKEMIHLRDLLNRSENQNQTMKNEIVNLKQENENLTCQKQKLIKEIEEIKDESKEKFIEFENQINKLTVTVDKAVKEKNKYETSLFVTREIVDVLSSRLRESDHESEQLEIKVQTINNEKKGLEDELSKYKKSLNDTMSECNEYKEALVNIMKSKAALTKEHTRMMEHNVTLIESLQNVEIEAYRELGAIKNELIEDVEVLKKESKSQIQQLKDEVEKKRKLCELAADHAAQANAAAEQSRVLLAKAAAEITRLEDENLRLAKQIQDQQSLVVELSLLRQENEELSMSLAKQSSIIDKMKKDGELQAKPKSPAIVRKAHKLGKENSQIIISPLRERNINV